MKQTQLLGRLFPLCLAGVLLFGIAQPAPMLGQVAGGTIQGLVSDPSGATIAGARVTVTETATGVSRMVSSKAG